MRLIDADALREAVLAAGYPMRTEILRLIDAAPTAMGWRDARREAPKRKCAYLVCFRNGGTFDGGISYWDRGFFRPDGTHADVPDYWMEFPAPPDLKPTNTEE